MVVALDVVTTGFAKTRGNFYISRAEPFCHGRDFGRITTNHIGGKPLFSDFVIRPLFQKFSGIFLKILTMVGGMGGTRGEDLSSSVIDRMPT